jgi:4-amino-4-deoxy-L-arabinose transferase-like glycosyltransferase
LYTAHPDSPWIDWGWTIGLLLAAIALLTFDLGNLPLRDWDEGLVAQVAREIWRSPAGASTWLHPTLWDLPYWNKPPLVHNLVAIAYNLGGVNEWMARLPGALFTASSVPLLYWIGREVFYARVPALFAAGVYLTSLPVVRLGRLAMLDGAVLAFLTLMILCVLRSRRNYRFALGIGLSLTGLCLSKGILLGLLLGGMAIAFLAWDTPRLLRQPFFWGGILLGMVPVGAWYGAQWQHYGAMFLTKNVGDQSLQRIWADVENNRGAPWYYGLELLKHGLPWLVFLPASWRWAWQNRELSWAKLAIAWGSFYFIAISLMATKLPWYALPMYPAIALLVGAKLADVWDKSNHGGRQYLPTVPYSGRWVAVFSALSLAAAGSGLYFSWRSPTDLIIQLILFLFGITLIATAILISRQNPQFIPVLIWGTYLTLGLFVSSQHWNWELAEDFPVKPVAALARLVPPGEKVFISHDRNRPSLNFYSDRPVIPVDAQRINKLWRGEPYLLLNTDTPPRKAEQVIGEVENWRLVTRSKNNPRSKTMSGK